MSAVRVAVDAANLVRDARGLGRVTRGVIDVCAHENGITLTLLARKRDDRAALARSFPHLPVADVASARRRDIYDVVWFPFNGMRFAAAAPTLVTIADAFAFTEPHPEFVARLREQAPIRRAARDATRIVTISQWSRGEIERDLPPVKGKIDVVRLSPDAFWQPDRDSPLPNDVRGTRYALVVGVREARKNARLALDAVEIAGRGRADEALVVVGDLSPADEAYARAIGLRTIAIAPDDATLRTLYSRAGVVLVPSFAEGFGLVAVEALACEAPLIVSNASALPEATRGCGVSLAPHDVAAWAQTIRHIYDDASFRAKLRAQTAAANAGIDRDAPARAMLALLRATAGV
jgi:glycosyltransferase involved in cell wall biosynthesis